MTTRLFSLAVLVAGANAQDDAPPDIKSMPGFGDKPCPNFRCSGEYVPVQKSRSKFESKGCSSMGGGMMMMGGDVPAARPYLSCCDHWHACYQTCGASKKSCDEGFKTCSERTCAGDADCQKSADMNSMMLKMGGCMLFDQGQYGACECIVEEKVEEKRAAAIRNFYKKNSPESVEKADSLAKKADSAGKMAALFKKLIAKYPESINKVVDDQQSKYQEMMNKMNAKKDKDDEGEDEGDSNIDEEVVDEL